MSKGVCRVNGRVLREEVKGVCGVSEWGLGE